MRPGDNGDGAGVLPGQRAGGEPHAEADAVRADDDLIEALSAGLVPAPSGQPEAGDVEEHLVALLAGWVADVRPETMLHRPGHPVVAGIRADAVTGEAVEPVDGDAPAQDSAGTDAPVPAAVAVPVGPRHLRQLPTGGAPGPSEPATERIPLVRVPQVRAARGVRRLPLRRMQVAAAAAALAVLAGSTAVAGAWEARPGTVLWPLTRIVYSDKARSVQAADDVTTNLNAVREALDAGNPAAAQQAMQVVLTQLPNVGADDGRAELTAATTALGQQLNGSASPDPAGTNPDPDRKTLASGSVGATIGPSPAPRADRAAPEPKAAAAPAAPPAAPADATPAQSDPAGPRDSPGSTGGSGPQVDGGSSGPPVDGQPAAGGSGSTGTTPTAAPPPPPPPPPSDTPPPPPPPSNPPTAPPSNPPTADNANPTSQPPVPADSGSGTGSGTGTGSGSSGTGSGSSGAGSGSSGAGSGSSAAGSGAGSGSTTGGGSQGSSLSSGSAALDTSAATPPASTSGEASVTVTVPIG